MGVSKNNGTPKSSILIGFSIINHPFWGFSPIFGNTQMVNWGCFIPLWGYFTLLTGDFGPTWWVRLPFTHKFVFPPTNF